jgi:hypothetical protein
MGRLQLCLVAAVGVLVLAACSYTGGGWIFSANDAGGKATFGFNFICKLTEYGCKQPVDRRTDKMHMNGNYTDQAANVKFSFDGALGLTFPFSGTDSPSTGGILFSFSKYTAKAGSGLALVLSGDRTPIGPSNSDFLLICVLSGPYGGSQYSSSYTPSDGSELAHELCGYLFQGQSVNLPLNVETPFTLPADVVTAGGYFSVGYANAGFVQGGNLTAHK